jgi:hypothetical protein
LLEFGSIWHGVTHTASGYGVRRSSRRKTRGVRWLRSFAQGPGEGAVEAAAGASDNENTHDAVPSPDRRQLDFRAHGLVRLGLVGCWQPPGIIGWHQKYKDSAANQGHSD